MKVIRRGVFETNSSSTHSITMCSKEDYDKWKRGELFKDRWDSVFVKPEDIDQYKTDHRWAELVTYEDYWDSIEHETFNKSYTTKNGEEIIAFGYYGYDG